MKRGTILYVMVGSVTHSRDMESWNGGGRQMNSIISSSGGGATDIRLTSAGEGSTDWRTGLESRIMVAGGGGASGNQYSQIGGAGGALIGLNGINNTATGGTQTSGGSTRNGVDGGFGYGSYTLTHDGGGEIGRAHV